MKNQTSAGGIGFLGLLGVAFIVLKLTNVISWSWSLVLLPIWGPFAFAGLVLIIGAVVEVAKWLIVNK